MSTLRLLVLSLTATVLLSVFVASAATNTVPTTALDEVTLPITANDLKPAECDALNLTTIIANGNNGSSANELILGTAGGDNVRGGKGNDCIVGGGGDDDLRGQRADDVLLGGPGDDSLDGGNNPGPPGTSENDVCYGEGGTDTFKKCESQVQ